MNQEKLLLPVWIMVTALIAFILHVTPGLFLWIVCSFFLFTLLEPVIEKLKSRGISSAFTGLAVIATSTLMIVIFLFVLYVGLASISDGLQSYQKVVVDLYSNVTHQITVFVNSITSTPIHEIVPAGPKISKVEVVDKSPLGGAAITTAIHGLSSAFTVIGYVVLCPLLTFFMLAERDNFRKLLATFYPDGRAPQVWKKITGVTKAFFVGNLILTGFSYPLFLVVFYIFEIKNPPSLAVVSAILNQVPFLGGPLSAVVPVLDLFSNGGSIPAAVALTGICLSVHFLLANLVTPKVIGSKIDLNATVSTLALIMWGEIWGGMGLILALPITAIIKILMQNSASPKLNWIAMMMSEDPDSLLNYSKRIKEKVKQPL